MRFEADGFEPRFLPTRTQSIHPQNTGRNTAGPPTGRHNLIARPCARHQSEGEIGGSIQARPTYPPTGGPTSGLPRRATVTTRGRVNSRVTPRKRRLARYFPGIVPVPNRQGHQQFQSSTPSLITHQAHGNGGKEDGEQQGIPLKKQPQARFIPLEKPGRAPETVECQETEKN